MSWRRVALLSALMATAGCAQLRDFLRAAVQEPAFVFKRLALENASLSGLTLDTVWSLTNPNSVGISLASVDYALFIEDKQVVAGAPKEGLQIAPNASSDLHFPAQVKFQDVVAVVDTFLNKDTAHYRAEGSVGVQTPLGLLRLPLAKSGEFEVPKVPAVVFGNPRVSNLSIQGVTIDFPLQVTNKNSYALPVAGLVGAVTLAGSNVGTLSTGNLGALDGRGTREVSVPLTVNFLSAGMGVFNAVQQGRADLRFAAHIQSDTVHLPLNIQQLVNFAR